MINPRFKPLFLFTRWADLGFSLPCFTIFFMKTLLSQDIQNFLHYFSEHHSQLRAKFPPQMDVMVFNNQFTCKDANVTNVEQESFQSIANKWLLDNGF